MKKRNITVLSDAFYYLARIFLNSKTDILSVIEFLLLIILYANFMFFDKVPLLGLVVLCTLWVARLWIIGNKGTVATPMDIPILGILALLPISLFASTDWSLSLPKVYGIILGVFIFYAVVNAIGTINRLELAITGIVLLSISVAFLGLVGADWTTSKLFSLPWVYELLPRLIRGVPRSISGGIQPNIVGGTLTFFIPFLVSLLFYKLEFKTIQFGTKVRLASILQAGYKPILFFSLVFTSFVLVLTQSRGSLAGVAVGLYVLALWHDRRFLWVIPLAAVGLFVMVQIWSAGNLAEFISLLDVPGGITFPGRVELWQRAIYIIQDFPFTGIGIGTFDPITHVLYPFFSIGPDVQVPHAHNMLLEVAVDLGIPGLVFYAALLSGFAFSAWRAYQVVTKPFRGLIVGLVCGMLAHQVFGIMDAFMLGTKLGAVMWVFIGLIAALYIRRDQLTMKFMGSVVVEKDGKSSASDCAANKHKSGTGRARRRLGSFFGALTYWALFSLLAIAFISDQPYLGLATALAGGGILGVICTTLFESNNSHVRME